MKQIICCTKWDTTWRRRRPTLRHIIYAFVTLQIIVCVFLLLSLLVSRVTLDYMGIILHSQQINTFDNNYATSNNYSNIYLKREIRNTNMFDHNNVNFSPDKYFDVKSINKSIMTYNNITYKPNVLKSNKLKQIYDIIYNKRTEEVNNNSLHQQTNKNILNSFNTNIYKNLTVDLQDTQNKHLYVHKYETNNKSSLNIYLNKTITLVEDLRKYFKDIGNGHQCFIAGTNINLTLKRKKRKCYCYVKYYGDDCGIPDAVWFGKYNKMYPETKLKRRSVPRRIINGFPVHHEFSMFESRIHDLNGVVDVFLIAESNYTAHGDQKPREFYNRLKEGYMNKFKNKILYIFLSYFPKIGEKNGWIADQYIRYYMGRKGLPLIQGLKDDDLFVLSDSDEIPTKEVLTFLKLYDGYTEPIAFGLRWNIFGFFWKYPADDDLINWVYGTKEKLTTVYSVATIGLFREVLLQNAFYIRKENSWKHPKLEEKLSKYKARGGLVRNWVAGTIGHYAGWHCSWCFSPPDIIKKMDAAQANDQPRWGSFSGKKNFTYLTEAIRNGRWFDDKLTFLPCDQEEAMYAPPYIVDHPHLYSTLLHHPLRHRRENQTL